MPDQSGSRKKILIVSAFVILISSLLFLNAINIGDFPLQGQAFFSGRSTVRIAAAFGLLIGLATALLFMIVRTDRSPSKQFVSVEARLREKAERQRAESPNMTSEKKEASSGLLSETAGELKTSVEVIQEELEEILDDDLPADKEHIQSLYEETDRLRKIIDGMEQLSQAQALARTLKKEHVQVASLLAAVVERTRGSVENSGIIYAVECDQAFAVIGDADCLGIIIGNIAENAARSIRGSGTVTLSADRAGGESVFTVSDTGTGIKRAHVGHIFERFFRGSGSGVGMGLAVVKELVDACGGKIQVQTQAGKGTTVTVRIPQ